MTGRGQVEVNPWSKWHERHNEKEGDVIRGNQEPEKRRDAKKLDYDLSAHGHGSTTD